MNLDDNIKPNFKTPENYFANLESNIFARLNFEENNLPKISSGFNVPELFFEENAKKLEDLIPAKDVKVISFKPNYKKIISIAAILVFSILAPMFYEKQEITPTENELTYLEIHPEELNETEIAMYLDEKDITELENELIYNEL